MSLNHDIHLKPIDHPVDQTVRLPGSKSLTNRVLLVAALAHGVSEIDRVLLADDTRLMIDALRCLGVKIKVEQAHHRAKVWGCGGHWPSGQADLDCGNAGTVIRFLTAACCCGHGDYRLDGVTRMRQRPIGGLVDALRDLGAKIGYEDREGFCPLTIGASGLRGGHVTIDQPPSSQFISALFMVTPLAAVDVMMDVAGDIPSQPYLAMTLGVMQHFGVQVAEEGMRKFIVPSQQTYSAARYEVEPDATAASYFFAAAAVTGGRITVDGLGSESCQGDIGFISVLRDMGCDVEQGPCHTTVRGPAEGRLRGLTVDLNDMPDVAPTLSVLAAFAEGPTRIRGIANLRIKETDRLASLSQELRKMGVSAEVFEDGLEILPASPPQAAAIDTYKDHRMAMSFALAGLRLEGMVIHDADCVNKTFPEFFELWDLIGHAP